ncbi:MAG: hypothetical protein L0I76_07095 [Pseudonocardia sp.]|nr:hypothetical protein [Pseudonocardia sp.]
MQASPDDLTGPILDHPVPREPATSSGRHNLSAETTEPDPRTNDAAWIALLVLGCAIVVAMLLTMVLVR